MRMYYVTDKNCWEFFSDNDTTQNYDILINPYSWVGWWWVQN